MRQPVVGKRYKGSYIRGGLFVGRCVSVRGEFWEFKLENLVAGLDRDWGIGDLMSVWKALVGTLVEIPLDAQG